MNKEFDEFFKKYLEEFINEIMSKAERLDLRYINEEMGKLSSIFEKHFSRLLQDENTKKYLIDFLKELDLDDILNQIRDAGNKKIKEFENKDKRILKLISLIVETDRIQPNISIVLLSKINPNNYIIKATRTNDLLELAEKAHGEYRVSCLMRFILGICESTYDTYVRILWEILSVLDGKHKINSKGKFGNIINNLIPKLNKLNMIELLEPNATLIRNAAAHESYDYDSNSDSVIIKETNGDKIIISSDELYEIAKKIYELTTIPLFMIEISNLNNKFYENGILELLLNKKDYLIKGERIDTKDFQDKITKMFEPIISRYKFER